MTKRTTTDLNDGLIWVVRIKDLQARAHVKGCQAIKDDRRKFIAFTTSEDKQDILSSDPANPGFRYEVVVCKCVP